LAEIYESGLTGFTPHPTHQGTTTAAVISHQPANLPINQPINQSANQSISQSISQSTSNGLGAVKHHHPPSQTTNHNEYPCLPSKCALLGTMASVCSAVVSYVLLGSSAQKRFGPLLAEEGVFGHDVKFKDAQQCQNASDGTCQPTGGPVDLLWMNTSTSAQAHLKATAICYNHLSGTVVLEDKCKLALIQSQQTRGKVLRSFVVQGSAGVAAWVAKQEEASDGDNLLAAGKVCTAFLSIVAVTGLFVVCWMEEHFELRSNRCRKFAFWCCTGCCVAVTLAPTTCLHPNTRRGTPKRDT
jgi:hypothetical protein